MDRFTGSVSNIFLHRSCLKQPQKAQVSAYKMRRIKRASCFIHSDATPPFCQTTCTSVPTFGPVSPKKRQSQSVEGHGHFIGNQIHHADAGCRGNREGFIKWALLANWQALMESARSIKHKLGLILVAFQDFIKVPIDSAYGICTISRCELNIIGRLLCLYLYHNSCTTCTKPHLLFYPVGGAI